MIDCRKKDTHSHASGYTKGCRCVECCAAASFANKRRYGADPKGNTDRQKKRYNSMSEVEKISGPRWRNYKGIMTREEYTEAVLLNTTCHACDDFLPNYTNRCVDHNHATGAYRGVLCSACNAAEGHLKTIERAVKLTSYMERHND